MWLIIQEDNKTIPVEAEVVGLLKLNKLPPALVVVAVAAVWPKPNPAK